jgi:hypothetical protein
MLETSGHNQKQLVVLENGWSQSEMVKTRRKWVLGLENGCKGLEIASGCRERLITVGNDRFMAEMRAVVRKCV